MNYDKWHITSHWSNNLHTVYTVSVVKPQSKVRFINKTWFFPLRVTVVASGRGTPLYNGNTQDTEKKFMLLVWSCFNRDLQVDCIFGASQTRSHMLTLLSNLERIHDVKILAWNTVSVFTLKCVNGDQEQNTPCRTFWDTAFVDIVDISVKLLGWPNNGKPTAHLTMTYKHLINVSTHCAKNKKAK